MTHGVMNRFMYNRAWVNQSKGTRVMRCVQVILRVGRFGKWLKVIVRNFLGDYVLVYTDCCWIVLDYFCVFISASIIGKVFLDYTIAPVEHNPIWGTHCRTVYVKPCWRIFLTWLCVRSSLTFTMAVDRSLNKFHKICQFASVVFLFLFFFQWKGVFQL